jgi:hypothetical protein
MKNIFIAAIVLLLTTTYAMAQEFHLTRILLNHYDDIPSDTAVNGLTTRGFLNINDGRVTMIVQLCAQDGNNCQDAVIFYNDVKITAASEHVAFMADGTEVNIIQISPKLIISMHVPYIGTDIFFFEPQ